MATLEERIKALEKFYGITPAKNENQQPKKTAYQPGVDE